MTLKVHTASVTSEEFDTFVALPENRDRRLEHINGEIVELVSSGLSSQAAARLLSAFEAFVFEHDLGWVTGADGGYIVAGEKYMPDCAFVSIARQSQPNTAAWNPLAPDLAVEVVSPTDRPDQVASKINTYLAANVVVVAVYVDTETIHIHRPGAQTVTLRRGDILRLEDVLPGFEIAVDRIFGYKSAADK